jgi:hypothetical protein
MEETGMKIGLYTDAPKHNFALMRIARYHRDLGDEVILTPALPSECDLTYGSWLYSVRIQCDIQGGPAFDPCVRLGDEFDVRPDYSIYPNLTASVGYTWPFCPNDCGFCVVPNQANPKRHRSIWDFHEERFREIDLLNNNTFSDPRWMDTFQEIWDADLTVIDQGGYDIRLLTEAKVEALNKTRFSGVLHFAWDDFDDYNEIVPLLPLVKAVKADKYVYVLVGYPDPYLKDEDLMRCQILAEHGLDPFIMIYNRITGKNAPPSMVLMNRYHRMVNRVFTWRNPRGMKPPAPDFEYAWNHYSSHKKEAVSENLEFPEDQLAEPHHGAVQ